MATKAYAQGANARRANWEDEARESPRRTGSWLPLDALDDDDPIYAGTPQLRAMPAAGKQVTLPQTQRPAQVAPTRARAATAARPAANPFDRVVSARAIALLSGALIAALATYVVLSAAIEWVQVKSDDFQYGRPRTVQVDAYVGQNEADGVPSHFIAMNLNRRVMILEMQGGDPTKLNTIVGPYLFGQGEDLTPVQLAVQDLNGDNKADLVVSVKSDQLLYLNDGNTFRLATAEERGAIEKSISKPKTGAAPTGAEVTK